MHIVYHTVIYQKSQQLCLDRWPVTTWSPSLLLWLHSRYIEEEEQVQTEYLEVVYLARL